MIEVDRLTKYYGPAPAIQDVSFAVEKGQIIGFLGPNGAGKTTTMRILSCFMPASSGAARVAGHDVFEQSLEVRRRIGYLPENVPLYGDMTVASYLDFVAEIKGVSRSTRRARVADVMDRCFIADMQHQTDAAAIVEQLHAIAVHQAAARRILGMQDAERCSLALAEEGHAGIGGVCLEVARHGQQPQRPARSIAYLLGIGRPVRHRLHTLLRKLFRVELEPTRRRGELLAGGMGDVDRPHLRQPARAFL